MAPENFFDLTALQGGVRRDLAPGITADVFAGDQAMVSIVRFEPNVSGQVHAHPEEQWGFCQSGSGIRVQGDLRVPVQPGAFWRTPGGTPHTMEAGPEGMVVIDVFAPPRKAYEKAGSGFGTEDA